MENNMIKLELSYLYTAQAVFNFVGTHLLEQNEQAIDGRGMCLYHTLGGLKCAIGCMIPENHSYTDVETLCVGQMIGVDHAHFYLLTRLQAIHDAEGKCVSGWYEELNDLAQEFGLEPIRDMHTEMQEFYTSSKQFNKKPKEVTKPRFHGDSH
jgi:hypothetical protein